MNDELRNGDPCRKNTRNIRIANGKQFIVVSLAAVLNALPKKACPRKEIEVYQAVCIAISQCRRGVFATFVIFTLLIG